jgi:hypothetical protein
MFKDKQFYHSTTKKAIIAFGTIFSNIQVERKNSAGEVAQSIRVPLAYSPKQKFLSRIAAIPDVESRGEVAITLPRMGFEITGIAYDPNRKISPINKNVALHTDSTLTARTSFVSTPYDLNLTLYSFAKNQEDALQIAEQIMPHFNPDFNVTVNDLPEMGIKRDIKIILDSITYEDQYEGSYSGDRQSIIWSFNFTMKLNYYGFVGTQGMIRKVIASTWQNPELLGEYVKQTYSVENVKATATATISSGAVNAVNLVYSGDKYTYAPNVTFSTGNARAEAVLGTDGKIESITVTNGGSGYSTAPTVDIEAPEGYQEFPGPADAYRFVEEFEQEFK